MNNKVWIYKKTDSSVIDTLKKKYGVSSLCALVLQNRTEIVGGDVDNLFKRVLYNLHNPFLLNDMDKAVERIEKSILKKEKITIYGDYDADGVTSTSILYMFLKENGADVDYYIPNRFTDGYGMNKNAISSIFDTGTKLIITVDNGIAAREEIEYAYELGIDVIVTDHHECPDELPKCCAVINPKRNDSTYPFQELSGAGVVFKLVSALNKGTLESIIKKYILISAIGTVADVVPLIDENRAIVIMGLKLIGYNTNIGIEALITQSGFSEKIGISDIMFGIVPKINAAGRIDSADICVKLLSSNNIIECNSISRHLCELNAERQQIEKTITDEAFDIINDRKLYKDNVIVVYKKGWNHGVIGIVASKICDKYYKPCIVLTDDEEDVIKGSGRSVGDFNLYDALSYCKDNLKRFGGHMLAAGLSLDISKLDLFIASINNYADNILDGNAFTQKIYIDGVLDYKYINVDEIKGLELLEPFGVGNPRPVFALNSVKVLKKQLLSDGKHIKLLVDADGLKVDIIGFSMGDFDLLINENDIIDIAGSVDINCFRGNEKVQIVLKDIKRIRHI